jgi:hypothetical protein
MSAIAQVRQVGGPGMLAIALILMSPSALALFASYMLVHRALYYVSALWFVYEISFYLGVLGVCLTVVLAIGEAVQRRIPSVFVWLMGIVALAATFFDWYASHIYLSPWTS